MHKFVSALTTATFLLAVTACGESKQEPTEPDTPTGLQCNSTNTRGSVSLNIAGNPGDSFRIIMKCGNQEVTRCTATIAAGANAATCTNTGPVPNGGTRSCPVGPGNGNTPAARVVASGCG